MAFADSGLARICNWQADLSGGLLLRALLRRRIWLRINRTGRDSCEHLCEVLPL
jgi:hypothetical protein